MVRGEAEDVTKPVAVTLCRQGRCGGAAVGRDDDVATTEKALFLAIYGLIVSTKTNLKVCSL